MSKIKLGLIGTGMAWERLHYPALERLRDKFEIKAVCDIDLQKARSAADKCGLPEESIYQDYHTMLDEADIEAIDLMVPIPKNFEIAKAVLQSEKHLLAEKPFAASVEEAKELIALANTSAAKVLVAENIRYDEENVIIKRLIEEKKIGNVVYFIDNNVTEFQKDMLKNTFAAAEWRQHPAFRGGVFLDSAIHHIARHRFLFGDAIDIYAYGRPAEVDFSPYSCINALLTFGGHISGLYSFYMIGKETQEPLVGFRIFGTEGEIFLEEKNCGFVNVSYKDGRQEALHYRPGAGYYHELENFYYAVREDKEIISTPEKESGDIQVIFDILNSIEK